MGAPALAPVEPVLPSEEYRSLLSGAVGEDAAALRERRNELHRLHQGLARESLERSRVATGLVESGAHLLSPDQLEALIELAERQELRQAEVLEWHRQVLRSFEVLLTRAVKETAARGAAGEGMRRSLREIVSTSRQDVEAARQLCIAMRDFRWALIHALAAAADEGEEEIFSAPMSGTKRRRSGT